MLDTRHDLVVKLAIALLVLGSHLLVASLFAVGFWLGAGWDLGGFEALTGFALISCSAQLFWSMMKKGDNA